ncbi:porin, partial [Shewanella algae]|uniref:porin n=1 Tax=Shewanella algae TaxID=38313 RepID=UPI0038B3ED02
MNIQTRLSLCILAALSLPTFQANASTETTEDGIKIGGAVRVNYAYRDYDEKSKDKGGDFNFDMAAIKFDGKMGDWGLAAEYRFTSSTNYIKYGYGYYQANDNWQLQFGINKVPFGNREFISNSWWFGLPYYLGFEDNHDIGIKAIYGRCCSN